MSHKKSCIENFGTVKRYKFKLQAGPGIELALAKALIFILQGRVEYQVRPSEPPRLIVRLPLAYKKSKVNL